jgi:preprotein translocase subunit SecY
MWLGENITEYGVGNGISIILTINIIAKLPSDFTNLFDVFVINADSLVNSIIAAIIIIAIVVVTVVLIVILQDAERRIKVNYSRKLLGGSRNYILLKVNTSGVIPVIFAISLLQFPIIISSFFSVKAATGPSASVWQKILYLCTDSNWFNFESFNEFKYTLGVVIYIALVYFFAYFYTSITFNPVEIADNLKKQGAVIPGVKPGHSTVEKLTSIVNRIIFIGASMLCVVALIPIFFTGVFNASISFGGTSLIIVVGVTLETMKQVEVQMVERDYKGFLNS